MIQALSFRRLPMRKSPAPGGPTNAKGDQLTAEGYSPSDTIAKGVGLQPTREADLRWQTKKTEKVAGDTAVTKKNADIPRRSRSLIPADKPPRKKVVEYEFDSEPVAL
ncbi:hypothetical protein [Rhizobium sp. RAF56]|uniref:hypothetical protein n=1 Tax=Rhizobium sp. RAF56 TaxID=3233062 RepID=UPI003F9BAECD